MLRSWVRTADQPLAPSLISWLCVRDDNGEGQWIKPAVKELPYNKVRNKQTSEVKE